MKRPVVAFGLPAAAALLSGCILVDLLMIPFQLIFGVVEAVGNGIGSLVAANVEAAPVEGPAPTVTELPDGRWLVAAPAEPARFRVTVSAPGHMSRTYTWPDDFRGVGADARGRAEITCALAPAAGGAPAR